MHEITHYHNQRPIYESDSGDIVEWDNPLQVSGETKEQKFPYYHPFIIDIETSAELGQRPILLIGYNTLESRLVVLYTHGYKDYELTIEKVKELSSIDAHKITLHNLSISNFEKFILKPIALWNKKARDRNDKNRISLVAHNAPFDIPMMGTPDDNLLAHPKIGNQYEMSVQYKDFKMVSYRAGQFGQIFTFLDSAKDYEPQYIPVGDTMVAAKSLWEPASLENACESLNIDLNVTVADEHGTLNDEYVKYCFNDVLATKKLYDKLTKRVKNMFGNLPIEHIYSTASIGKYVLRKMNYKRVGYSQEAIDRIAPAYFGGRTDAEITGEIIKDLRYTDILSEYPTVSKLTNVWSYMQAEYVTIEKIDKEELPSPTDLTNPNVWEDIANYYVKIDPNGATLPIRTRHLDKTTKVVTSIVESEKDLQYHYMDILSAELIDGERKPDIKAAWKVKKHGKQELKKTEIAGVKLQPYDNVMAKTIESRKEIVHHEGKGPKTISLKITGNSLYGVSAERIVKEHNDEKHDYAAKNGFYNPHVAATITAGGRLMLALGESKANEFGGKMYYCDTDSLILDTDITERVIDAFSGLNPYDGIAGDLPVLEDEKGVSGNLYAVGTKKYIFFSNDGKPLEVKEHGLGNYENLRGKEGDYDIINRLWATIMYYDFGENPLDIPVLYDNKLNEFTVWSFNATTVTMRQMIDEFTGDYIRYGDWVQSTLSYDNKIRYLALDLMEKDATDSIVKVEAIDENVNNIKTVEKSEMLTDERIKTVRDVIMKFVQDAAELDERPKVNVIDTQIVTKEATNRKDIFMEKLDRQFTQNMSLAMDSLFGKELSKGSAD